MRNLFLLLLLLNLLLALWEGQPQLLGTPKSAETAAPATVDGVPSWVLLSELRESAGEAEPVPAPDPPLARLQPLMPGSSAATHESPRCYQFAPFIDAQQRNALLGRLAAVNFALLGPLPAPFAAPSRRLILTQRLAPASRARLGRTVNELGLKSYVAQNPQGEEQLIVNGFDTAEAIEKAHLQLAQQGFLFRVELRKPAANQQRITIATSSSEAISERLDILLRADGRSIEALSIPCEGELLPAERPTEKADITH